MKQSCVLTILRHQPSRRPPIHLIIARHPFFTRSQVSEVGHSPSSREDDEPGAQSPETVLKEPACEQHLARADKKALQMKGLETAPAAGKQLAEMKAGQGAWSGPETQVGEDESQRRQVWGEAWFAKQAGGLLSWEGRWGSPHDSLLCFHGVFTSCMTSSSSLD